MVDILLEPVQAAPSDPSATEVWSIALSVIAFGVSAVSLIWQIVRASRDAPSVRVSGGVAWSVDFDEVPRPYYADH